MSDEDPEEAALRGLFKPARHAANNLAMVLVMNLEGALRLLPEGGREARQVARSLEAAQAYDGLLRGLLALTRDAERVRPRAEAWLREVLPLLGLAAGRPLRLDVSGAAARLDIPRPRLDALLVGLMRERPATAEPALRLDGATLSVPWPAGEAVAAALAAAGVTVAASDGGTVLHLPQPPEA